MNENESYTIFLIGHLDVSWREKRPTINHFSMGKRNRKEEIDLSSYDSRLSILLNEEEKEEDVRKSSRENTRIDFRSQTRDSLDFYLEQESSLSTVPLKM